MYARSSDRSLCCSPSLSSRARGFRVALTGVTLEADVSFDVVKKLKLVGEPARIHKRTVFLKVRGFVL